MASTTTTPRPRDAAEPEVTAQSVRLPWGLLGFESHTAGSLASDPALHPFQWLALNSGEPGGFVVLDPSLLPESFDIDIDDADCESMGVSSPDELRLLVIVTVSAGGRATANLKGPLVHNPRTGCLRQVIPRNAASLPIQHPLPAAHADPEPQDQ